MTKTEFVLALNEKISDLSQKEKEDSISFYTEMIEDRIEDGVSEEDAVAAVGSVNDIAALILSERKVKNGKPRKFKWWEITLIIIGSPVWLSLLISLLAAALSLYVGLWAIVISLWAVFGSVVAYSFYGVASGIGFICAGNTFGGIALIGTGVFGGGVSIFLFYGCTLLSKFALWIPGACFGKIKKSFGKKEEKQ